MTAQEPTPKGNFIVSENQQYKPGTNRPLYKNGYLTAPGSEEKIAINGLWGTKSAKGIVLSGELAIPETLSAIERQQMRMGANEAQSAEFITADGEVITIEPGRVVLYTNTAGKSKNPNAPDFFGHAVGFDGQVIRVSAWGKTGQYGPFLGGNTEAYTAPEQSAKGNGARTAPKGATSTYMDL